MEPDYTLLGVLVLGGDVPWWGGREQGRVRARGRARCGGGSAGALVGAEGSVCPSEGLRCPGVTSVLWRLAGTGRRSARISQDCWLWLLEEYGTAERVFPSLLEGGGRAQPLDRGYRSHRPWPGRP